MRIQTGSPVPVFCRGKTYFSTDTQIIKFTVNNFIQVGTVHLNVCINGKKKKEEAHGQIGKVRKHQIMRNLICHADHFGFDPVSSGHPSEILICGS